MARFPTEVEQSVTVKVPPDRAYEFFWNVVDSSACVPGLASCKPVADDTYQFVFEERSRGPVSLVVRYTSRYEGNGRDRIRFRSVAARDDNTDIEGELRFEPSGEGATRIVLHQTMAPDTPVPRLVQGLVRSFVEKEAAGAVEEYLAGARRALER